MSSFRSIGAALIAAGFIVITPGIAGAASSSQQTTLQNLAGTWSCVTQTSDNKTLRETDVDAMYGNWLRSNATYLGDSGQPAGTSTTFIGYDAKKALWVVTGVGTDGTYFTATSSSPNFHGSTWTDVFPDDHGGTVIHLTPYTQYSMDSHGPDPTGKMSTNHTVCTKQ